MLFRSIFLIELFIKFAGDIKWKNYHYISAALNILSVTGSIIQTSITGKASAILCLETLRIYVIFRVNDYFKKISNVLIEMITSICPLIIVLFVFVYSYAVIGLQLFAGKLYFNSMREPNLENGIVPRKNYDTLAWSLITTLFHHNNSNIS